MDFDAFIARAWEDHDASSVEVAARLEREGLALVGDEAQWSRLAHLAHHVHGEHLHDPRGGLTALDRLAASPHRVAGGSSDAALARYRASFEIAADDAVDAVPASPSDRARVRAMAAACVFATAPARAHALLRQAADDAAALEAADPAHGSVAATANNLAVALESRTDRSPGERDLMLFAAATARRHWSITGSWLETERADYRLAMSWLAAGDPTAARSHAAACLAIVDANGGAPLERFFAFEAIARVEGAAGDIAAADTAVHEAERAFAALEPADQAWCRASLDRLAVRRPPAS